MRCEADEKTLTNTLDIVYQSLIEFPMTVTLLVLFCFFVFCCCFCFSSTTYSLNPGVFQFPNGPCIYRDIRECSGNCKVVSNWYYSQGNN